MTAGEDVASGLKWFVLFAPGMLVRYWSGFQSGMGGTPKREVLGGAPHWGMQIWDQCSLLLELL